MKNNTRRFEFSYRVWARSCAASFFALLLIAEPVAKASDLQIYASASAGGRKTFVMMLDTSKSMMANYDDKTTGNSIAAQGYDAAGNPAAEGKCDKVSNGSENSNATDTGRFSQPYTETVNESTISYQRYYCTTTAVATTGTRYYDRLTRLKDGMFALLNTNDSRLDNVYMGLGQYPIADFAGQDSQGNGVKSRMLVPAARLGGVNSEQRIRLKRAIAGLEAWGQTPMAHAYAEAASYLLGTSTSGSDSGFSSSANDTKTADLASYASPLPATARTCHAQGIYLMTDGEPDNTTDQRALGIMQQALKNPGFSCSGSALSGNASSGWECMGNFSRSLFNATTNPKQRSIVTALAGFNGGFGTLQAKSDQYGCALGSRTQSDRSNNDACSPGTGSNPVNAPGYGNGGFFAVLTKDQIKDSVVSFITNLSTSAPEPLATGAISVPADELNPNGFQPYGYLRMLEPNPASQNLIWKGNLKKYYILNGALAEGNTASADLVFDSNGGFNSNTRDLWNSTGTDDGGLIERGGAYSRVSMPTITTSVIRPLFTDVASVNANALQPISSAGASLLKVPVLPASYSNLSAEVRAKFDAASGQPVLKDFPLVAKLKLLNYLGYDLPLTSTSLPATLTPPATPFLAMGGLIHSFPVQLTYSGSLDANGQLTSARTQSVAYGSMEGGLHLVNASTGVEQMVFVPAELLNADISRALRKGEAGTAPSHGVDAPWVADPAYRFVSASSPGSTSTVEARQMNLYGGLRMGGNSYYGLDVLSPTAPKLLFRVGSDQSDFSRMGQSWSKPVLANIRHNGTIKRVMIVGGGYDTCYENPRFKLAAADQGNDLNGQTCSNKTIAQGNAVYIIDAKTGARLWWASNTDADTNSANLKHSVVSRISTLDRDADGLVDHLYFGDLGGQVFRADLNNNQAQTSGTYSGFGVRVVRLTDLAYLPDTTGTSVTQISNGDNPRFYEPPTLTIHDQGSNTFILVGIASGDRSTPLDVAPAVGERGNATPATPLTGRPVNHVYGIIDRDFIKLDLISNSSVTLTTQDKTLINLQKNPQTLASGSAIIAAFFPATGTGKDGWYRSLSSTADGTERANGTFRKTGGLKAFEEPIAITGNLIIPVYDPEGTGIDTSDSCQPRVIGETDRQRYCLPFGACLMSSGDKDISAEAQTGFKLTTADTNANVIGTGIRGVSLAPSNSTSATSQANSCGNLTLMGNTEGSGAWQCSRKLVSTRWYERFNRS